MFFCEWMKLLGGGYLTDSSLVPGSLKQETVQRQLHSVTRETITMAAEQEGMF